MHTFSFKKMHLKILSAKWRQFCLGLSALIYWERNNIAATMQMKFLIADRKTDFILIQISLKCFFWGSNYQNFSIGPGNDWAASRGQIISWTDTNPVNWRLHASLGLGVLTQKIHRWPHKCKNNCCTCVFRFETCISLRFVSVFAFYGKISHIRPICCWLWKCSFAHFLSFHIGSPLFSVLWL